MVHFAHDRVNKGSKKGVCASMAFQIKRIYADKDASDGWRVLVDRLWPRGVSKERAALNAWMKDAAPSPALRIWFGHQPDRMAEFAEAYRKELDTDAEKQQAVAQLRQVGKKGMVSLLYGAKDPKINHAIVLKAYLEGK